LGQAQQQIAKTKNKTKGKLLFNYFGGVHFFGSQYPSVIRIKNH